MIHQHQNGVIDNQKNGSNNNTSRRTSIDGGINHGNGINNNTFYNQHPNSSMKGAGGVVQLGVGMTAIARAREARSGQFMVTSNDWWW